MDQQKPEYFRPALIAGAVAGLLSGLPVRRRRQLPLLPLDRRRRRAGREAPGQGHAGRPDLGRRGHRRGPDRDRRRRRRRRSSPSRLRSLQPGAGPDGSWTRPPRWAARCRPALDGLFQGAAGTLSPGWFLLGLFLTAAVFAVFGALGGIIGVSLFAKKPPGSASSAASGHPPCGHPEDPPMRLKTKVIVNPESNRGRTRKRWGEIREGLKHFVREFKYEFTEKPLHATDLARRGHQGRHRARHRRRRRRDDERDRQRLLRGPPDHQPRGHAGPRPVRAPAAT
ncbi:MAG: hypothetical protein M0C28_04815 [Candidatus Moduliflexus flocculans]|nr:hypothetical protein [Candidatus Moduliflexus flocculans]